jgi:DNA repair exonuclease SbcCD nuclease subunit
LNEAQIVPGMSLTSNIRMSDLKKWKLVLLGHYHLPQLIDGKGTMVYYTGSPYQKDWNEKHQEKRFLVYDSKTLEVESVLTDGYRKYIELIIDNDNKENAKDILAEAKQQRANGHHVRVRNKTEEVIDESDVFVISEKEIDITNRGVEITMSTADKLRKYAEIKEVPESDISEYLKMGIELCQNS